MLTDAATPWVCIDCRLHLKFGAMRLCKSCHSVKCPGCGSHNIYPADGSVIEMAAGGLEYRGVIGTIN